MVVDPRAAEAARVAGMTGEVSQAPLRPPRVARRSPRVDCRVGCGHVQPCGYLFSRVPEALSEPNSVWHSPQCGECHTHLSHCVRWPARLQRYPQGRVSRFEASVTGGACITGATSPVHDCSLFANRLPMPPHALTAGCHDHGRPEGRCLGRVAPIGHHVCTLKLHKRLQEAR